MNKKNKMNEKSLNIGFTLNLVIAFLFCFNYVQAEDKLLNILNEGLNYEFNELKQEETPPYYIEYRVSDYYMDLVNSSFGSLTKSDNTHSRFVNIVVKVGDYKFDNTHKYTDEEAASDYNYNFSTILPLDNNETAIKQILWWYTNKAYLNALSIYKSINEQDKSKQKNSKKRLDDFSIESPSHYYEEPLDNIEFNRSKWEKDLKEISAMFLNDTSVIDGNASVNSIHERKYLVNSEGTSVVQNVTYSQLQITSTLRNNKGNAIPVLKSYVSKLPEGLPSKIDIMNDMEDMFSTMKDFKTCTTAEPYSGPAILSSDAAGVFFHEIFGHRIEGHRLKDESDAQTFKEMIGSKVLPKTFNVYFDPREEKVGNTDLIGHYVYDDEGVKSQKVDIVENGILKTFLMSRTPVEGLSKSNGHGRAQTGYEPVARQSNMFIKSNDPLSDEALRKKLIKTCKSKGLKYGYYFKTVYGGFTYTTRYMPNVFNIFPLEVYRIYVDGRPDELVRGVELIGTPLAMFSEIEAAGNTYNVFNGFCGAESGMVPVSTIAPAIFVKKVETQSQPNVYINVPILKMPVANDINIQNKEEAK